MGILFNVPWEKYGLIAELAYRLDKLSIRFGKTALQKFIYLLQELYDLKVGYDFSLYTYGPFSSELLGDLDYVASLNGVNVNFLPDIHGYQIVPGTANESIRSNAQEFLIKSEIGINRVIEDFGNYSAKDLELRSTIIFVDRDLKNSSQPPSNTKVINLVQEIKPYFSKSDIELALLELEEKGYIQ